MDDETLPVEVHCSSLPCNGVVLNFNSESMEWQAENSKSLVLKTAASPEELSLRAGGVYSLFSLIYGKISGMSDPWV